MRDSGIYADDQIQLREDVGGNEPIVEGRILYAQQFESISQIHPAMAVGKRFKDALGLLVMQCTLLALRLGLAGAPA